MKNFIKQLILFFIVLGLIILIGIFLPVTPRSKNNMLNYKSVKDSLLIHTEKPRIIFVGGSNLVFGLNSQVIKDSLQVNPINNGLAVALGLVYMMDDLLPYIKEGDLVVLVPEYNNFYGDFAYGSRDFFRFLMDVDPKGFNKLRKEQLPNLLFKSIPTYFQSKFHINNYLYDVESDYHSKFIFNQYGDSEYHWKLPPQKFKQIQKFRNNFNYRVLREIVNFADQIKSKGGAVIIAYPGFQESSMEIITDHVKKIDSELRNSGIQVIGSPERYAFPDSLMFDQVYHLTKEGVDIRTHRLVEDLKPIIEAY